MKLSSVLAASALFLSGITASPIAAPSATEISVAFNETNFQSDNSTEVSIEGSKFCFHANQKIFCHGGNESKCRKYYSSMPAVGPNKAPSYCGFWCTKMKKTEDCGFNKIKFNYEPDWSCKDAKFNC
ncbi:putative secreted protein [Wickerhamomyces ciferrii]|uniref:Secreted protein n=1 Tax=Wickerhamomyces ciferrii (strain ATCC 14091 / BCRC 22168 / CBS 111 / JCM 3599 / NBRC 0793 / NRRL Y-1031 F-60-10) TaxID=1206466 RepID=K0KWW0_WICCF|nr:uncharacterized protein BN7_6125 [Wickerhamomyces ciferrii]CCH46532.1 putative secreted protein [Wickerhamomyces ciferrii]